MTEAERQLLITLASYAVIECAPSDGEKHANLHKTLNAVRDEMRMDRITGKLKEKPGVKILVDALRLIAHKTIDYQAVSVANQALEDYKNVSR